MSNFSKNLDEIFKKSIRTSVDIDKEINTGPIDEVALYDSFALEDRDRSLGKSKFELLEDNLSQSSIFGISIDNKRHSEIMNNRSVVAIDGSSTRIARDYVSMIIGRVAIGTHSYKSKMPAAKIVNTDFRLLISTDAILRENNPKIKKMSGMVSRNDTLRNESALLQANMESQIIPKLIDDEKQNIDIIGIDGPLYYRSIVGKVLPNVQYALDAGKEVFGIVKRSQDNSYTQFLQNHAKKFPKLGIPKSWYLTDREYLLSLLSIGERTPIYKHINQHEYSIVKPNMQRVCCYVRLTSGRICRLEMPYELANESNEFEPLINKVEMVYHLSKLQNGKLPLFFHRADTAALINEADRKNFEKILNAKLKERGFSTNDPEDWK